MTGLLGVILPFLLLCGFLYVLWQPRWAAVVVLVMFPLMQLMQTYSPFLAYNHQILNYSIGFLALFAVASRFFRGERMLIDYYNPITWSVWGILAIAVVGILWSPGADRALGIFQHSFPYYVLFLILLPMLLRDLSDLQKAWVGIMLVGGLIAIFILMSPHGRQVAGRFVLEVGMMPGEGRLNPLALGSLGGLVALIGLLIRFERAGWLLMVLRLAAVAVGFGLAVASGARGQVLACLVAAAVFYPLSRQLRNPGQFFAIVGGLATFAVLVFLTFAFMFEDGPVGRWRLENMLNAAGSRFERALIILEVYINSPAHWLFGLGPAAYSTLGLGAYVHNQVVEIITEMGLAGLTLLTVILVCCTIYLFRMWRWYRFDPTARATVTLLAAALTYDLITSLKQGTVISYGSFFIWMMIVGKIYKFEEHVRAEQEELEPAEAGDPLDYGEQDPGWSEPPDYAIARSP